MIIAIVAAMLILAAATVVVNSRMNSGSTKLELDENATTGYLWHFEIENGSVVEITKDEHIEGKNDGIVGAAGKHIWEFKGVSPGKAIMKLEYYRSWEGVEGSAESRIYEITINNKRKVDIKQVK